MLPKKNRDKLRQRGSRSIYNQRKQQQNKRNMKTFTKSIAALIMPGFARACTMLCIGTLLTINISAQTPPPPNGGQTPGEAGNTPVGGGAPIGGGLLILVALGASYGGKKVWDFKKQKLAE